MNYDFKSFVRVVRGTEPQFSSYCPFHNDRSPSFSFNSETGLWKCHAGCGAGSYEMFLQMFKSGLNFSRHIINVKPYPRIQRSLQFKLVAEYLYQNAEGQTCLRVKRYEDPTGAKSFTQESITADGFWIPKKTTEVLAPYQYESWKHSEDCILFVEGEKCADMLSRLRFQATTIPGGANAWKDSFVSYFDGKIVRILPDNDKAGSVFGDQILKSLKPVVKDIRLVQLPDLPYAGDVYNWFTDGSDKSDNEKMEEFLRLIE